MQNNVRKKESASQEWEWREFQPEKQGDTLQQNKLKRHAIFNNACNACFRVQKVLRRLFRKKKIAPRHVDIVVTLTPNLNVPICFQGVTADDVEAVKGFLKDEVVRTAILQEFSTIGWDDFAVIMAEGQSQKRQEFRCTLKKCTKQQVQA